MLISGSASSHLTESVSKSLGMKQVEIKEKRFTDGEIYRRIISPLPLPDEVYIIQSTYRPQNDNLMELLILCSIAQDNGTKEINVISPYFGYARSDRIVLEGEYPVALLVQNLLVSAGATHLAVCDIHNPAIFSPDQYLQPDNLTLENEVAAFFGNYLEKDDLVMGPDHGALKRAQEVAHIIGCGASAFEKVRDAVTHKSVSKMPDISVKGKKVLIVDDIIATGGSMVAAIDMLYSHGAEEVSVCVSHITHPNPVELDKTIVPKVSQLVSTNSIPTPYSKIDLTETISSYIQMRKE